MTIEEIRGSLGGENGNIDKFPVGMRVLAVDDDPTCLMLLDCLLRKCQYQVTTTSQAKTALKMLRENRNRFDLIISDVHMPDMDGFKLLELVGLEMDLPVIMLSANSDAKLVMKGITHGACDYLVKPVRIEELRNIWQHVIRKKKVETKNPNKSTTRDKAQNGSEDGDALTCSSDQNGKLNRKRKDEEEEGDDNGNESDDPSTQKKPRVVWSIELHRKFVAAVNQLGIEKAVPKRILDMMNVEGLTRENVASHLQKYRLYLKRISSVATQQANMVAALGGKDSSYIRIGSLDGLGDYRTLSGSGRIQNTALQSYPQSGMLGRLNTPAGVNLLSLASSPLIQTSHAQNSGHSINNLGKFQPVVSPINQNASFFQGVPTSLDLDQLQHSKGNTTTTTTHFGELNSYGTTTNPMLLQGTPQQMQSGGGFGNQSSFNLTSLKSEPLAIGFHDSSSLLDHGRCNENWDSAVQLSKFSSNSLPSSESFNHNQLLPTRLQENNSSIVPYIQNGPLEISSTSTVSAPLADARGAIQCRAGLVGDFVPSVNQRWGEHKQDQIHNSANIFNPLNSIVPASGRVGPFGQSLDQLDGVCNRKMDVSLLAQSNSGPSPMLQHGVVEKSTVDSKIRSNEDYLFEQMKLQGGFVPNNYDSLDDLVNAMTKRDQEGTVLMDGGEFGFDNYSFGSCI